MEERNLIYEGNGERIDIFLKEKLGYSREFIKKLIKENNIKVNSNSIKPSHQLKNGDIIKINITEDNKISLKLSDIKIYEDDDVLVINKPQGLLVHPTDENWIYDPTALEFSKNTLVWLLYSSNFSKEMNKLQRLGLVHRLDAETSGVMIIAKTLIAQKKLQDAFANREVFKQYKAVVEGVLDKKELTIDAPIGRFTGSKKLKVTEYGREAITEIKLIKQGTKNCYLDVFPKTGRTNQIRVHLSFINHPIIGDKIYSKSNYERLMLHSYKIVFNHPSKLKTVEFISKPDSDFQRRMNELLK